MKQTHTPPTSQTLQSIIRNTIPYAIEHANKYFLIHLPFEALTHKNIDTIIRDIMLLSKLNTHLFITFDIQSELENHLKEQSTFLETKKDYFPISDQLLSKALHTIADIELKIQSFLASNTLKNHQKESVFIQSNFFTAKPLGILEGIDMQNMGTIRSIHTNLLDLSNHHSCITLISPKSFSFSGNLCLLHPKDIISSLTTYLPIDKLILFTDTSKVIYNGNIVETLTPSQLSVIYETNPTQWQYPTIQSAIQNGLSRAHLISYEQEDSLLIELFTIKGHGSQVTNNPVEHIKPASLEEVDDIFKLLTPHIENGKILPKTKQDIQQDIHHYFVLKIDHMIVACVAIYHYPEEKMLEISSLAIEQNFQKHTTLFFNQTLAEALLEHAYSITKKHEYHSCFALSTQTAEWFLEQGFSIANLSDLPLKKQTTYNTERSSIILIKSI